MYAIKTTTDMNSEMEAMTRRVICGHVFVPAAHGGRLFRVGSAFVALKIEKTVASMERTIRLQAKLIPRRKILAIRTRTFTFCLFVSQCSMVSWESIKRGLRGLLLAPSPSPARSFLASALPGRWG